MVKIKIEMEVDEKYCLLCPMQERSSYRSKKIMCTVFSEYINENGERLPECLAAEVKE